ncbi:hypothetical protein Tco_1575921 [Tanacetum coccineum]
MPSEASWETRGWRGYASRQQQQGTSKGSQIKRLKHDGQQLRMLILKEYIGLHDFWKQQMWILELLSLWAVVDGSVPAGRLCGSYWSTYGFFCLPCSILFVIAASIIELILSSVNTGWSCVVSSGRLVLAGFIMFMLIVGLGFCWSLLLVGFGVPTGCIF